VAHDDTDEHGSELSPIELRVKALESLLVEKGFVDPTALDAIVDTYERKVGPQNGAKVVAKAWCDPEYADWLRRDAASAIASMNFEGRQFAHLEALFNTASVHNIVVCTLCSCYPWVVLGLPPTWFKSAPYKSRVVLDPRSVLADFGVQLPEDVEVRVWDSTSELRYIVIPMRPAGTTMLNESELAALVTRDSMIGTGFPRLPT
jgi:nitrile hydratase subunit alpha